MICPSILSADFSKLKETLPRMEECGIQVVHFDVMDNHFVPNLTFGPKFIGDLRKYSGVIFDVHLMINSPENTLEQYLDAGADYLTVHYEATSLAELAKMSRMVRSAGKKFGISIKPQTPGSVYTDVLELMDLALIMSVEPGFGGQKLIGACLDKIRPLKTLAQSKKVELLVQVDGGINSETLPEVVEARADWFVMGSAFFKETDYTFFPKKLEEIKAHVR